jgi:hypothetical protein
VTTADYAPPVTGDGGVVHPLVVELVGAAAAGKSTLVAELQRGETGIEWLQRAQWGDSRAALARQALRHAPGWFAAAARSPIGYAWRNARYFLRLAALESVVGRAMRNAPRVVMLEHGPVFTLARVRAFHEGPMPAPLARYAARLLARWARKLDLVIALDAPDDVLAERLRTRSKPHAMRDRTDDEFSDFVHRYRAAYEAVLAQLSEAGGPPLLVLRTDQLTVPVMADRVRAALEERRHAQ